MKEQKWKRLLPIALLLGVAGGAVFGVRCIEAASKPEYAECPRYRSCNPVASHSAIRQTFIGLGWLQLLFAAVVIVLAVRAYRNQFRLPTWPLVEFTLAAMRLVAAYMLRKHGGFDDTLFLIIAALSGVEIAFAALALHNWFEPDAPSAAPSASERVSAQPS